MRLTGGSIVDFSSFAGVPAFLVYFVVAGAVVVAYLLVYTWITPHDEFALIRANVPGAAMALGMSMIGFALPVGSAIAHSANIIDCVIWSVVGLVVQVIVYFLARIPDPDLSRRIAAGETASALWLGLASITGGILSAASMTY
jgi:putative membrane protein